MIAAIPSPMDGLTERLRGRWARWVDSLCVELPDPPEPPRSTVSRPEPHGLPRVLQDLQRGAVSGSQRDIAKMLGTSRATVQRAQRVLRLADIP
jgi:hypothetical protein